MSSLKLPTSLRRLLGAFSIESNRISRLGGVNQKLLTEKGETVYLKFGQGVAAESLVRENKVLNVLDHSKILLPEVLYFSEAEEGTHLLLSAVPGLAAQLVTDVPTDQILSLIAEGLKSFHSHKIPVQKKLRTLDDDLAHIERCIKYELLDSTAFKAANQGKTPQEVHSYLIEKKSLFAETSLVHGDYCLPNIIINSDQVGFIDVGDAGPGDLYKDLSALEVSLNRNFGSSAVPLFYEQYNSTLKVDPLKIKYFQYIDQFGYHLNVEKYKASKLHSGFLDDSKI